MKFEYRTIIYVLFVCFTISSCNSQCKEQLENQKDSLSNALTKVYSDSFNLKVRNYQDTLFIDLDGLPEYTTGKDYNMVIFSYLMYNLNLDSIGCAYYINLNISHDYNDLYYNFISDMDRVKWVTIDYYAIKNYDKTIEFMLKNFSDRESAFVNLIFKPVSEYYPKFTYDEDLFNILSKLHAINNGGANGYTEDKQNKLKFALMWLYFSSDFSFEDLPFPKDRLEEFLEMSNIPIKKDLNREDIDEFYKNHFE